MLRQCTRVPNLEGSRPSSGGPNKIHSEVAPGAPSDSIQIEVVQPMASISTSSSRSESRLASSDSRPIIVTFVVVGYLLICGLGGLNAFVVLLNGSPRITLMESSPTARIEALELGGEMIADVRNPELVVLDRIFAGVYIAVAIAGIAGAIGLLRRKSWSRVLLWTITAGAITAHALYTLRVLQIQTAEIANVFERQEVFELMSATSLINVAIQSIPLTILAGLLRHSALRHYVFGSSDARVS